MSAEIKEGPQDEWGEEGDLPSLPRYREDNSPEDGSCRPVHL